MKKKAQTLLILLIVFTSLSAQTFEGKIIYKNKLKYATIISTLFIKGDSCRVKRSINNSEVHRYTLVINNQSYIVDENTHNILKDTSNSILANNLDLIELKKKETIQGYDCSIYKENKKAVNDKNGIYLSVANSLFTNIKITSLAVNGKIILKSILKTSDYEYINEAVEVLPMKLDNSLFELPNYPIRKVNMENMAMPLLIESRHK